MRNVVRFTLVCVLLGAVWAAPVCAQTGTPLKVVTYTVQPGDTISGISEYFYADRSRTEWIAAYNRLANANRISVGQRLDIPFYDIDTWHAYANRTNLSREDAEIAVGGGSQDVAVSGPREHVRRSRRFWAIVIYSSLALVLTAILYIRSRRQEYTALGVGAPRR